MSLSPREGFCYNSSKYVHFIMGSAKEFFRKAGNWQVFSFPQLLGCAKKRDPEALSTLYQHFLPAVFGSIASRIADQSTTEDLTSEVFLKMLEGIHRVQAQDEASFAAWLFRIVTITVARYYQSREKGFPCSSLDSAYAAEYLCRLEDNRLEKQTYLAEAYCQLTEEQRAVLTGCLMMDYDAETVGDIIGKNANAVRALQFRALRSLRRILSKRKDCHEVIS